MKNSWINECHVEGYVFSHSLSERVCGPESRTPSQEFITGSIEVATNESATNVISVNFTFVTPTYKSGKSNATYEALKTIMSGPTFETFGSSALKVRIDGDVECNDFVSGRTGEMVSAKRMRGSFVHIENNVTFKDFATFKTEMLINNFSRKENSETGEETATLRGYAFNFRGDLVPVTYDIRSKAGMDYYERQEISNANPVFDTIQGKIISTTLKKNVETEGAWGEPIVDVTTVSLRSWEVVSSSGVIPMEDCGYMTKEELKGLITRREEYLASVRKRFDDRNKTKKTVANNSPAKPVAAAEAAVNEAMMVF